MESLFQIYIGDVYLHLKNNFVSSKIMVLFTTGLYFYLLIIEVIHHSWLLHILIYDIIHICLATNCQTVSYLF